MRSDPEYRLVIAGGGLAGCLAALALAELRPDLPFLLVEKDGIFGGNHLWSFFDTDIAPDDRWLVEPLISASWADYDILFPARRRTLPTGYNSIRSDQLHQWMLKRLRPDQYLLGTDIAHLGADGIRLADGREITAAAVIDARGAADFSMLDLAWQKFVGREYQLAAPHGLARPIIMDATVDQTDGYRFVYSLPFSEQHLLVEDTYYTLGPDLDRGEVGRRIEAYMAARGWRGQTLENEETGVLPVALGGDFEAFWPAGAEAFGRLGLRGGFFHPTTGYTLPDAVRTAIALARQEDLSGFAVSRMLRDKAVGLWRERGYYRLLNRMLFNAAAPVDRYRVLQHFYRLDPPVIDRFYAGRSSLFDRLRIVSGKPPVPIRKAVAAMWNRTA